MHKYEDIKESPFDDALGILGVKETLLVHQYDYLTSNLKKTHQDVEKIPLFKRAVNK